MRREPGSGFDREVLAQIQKNDLLKSKFILVRVLLDFGQPQQTIKVTLDKNESKIFFSGSENKIPGVFKNSGIKTELIIL